MGSFMGALIDLLRVVLQFYTWIILAAVIVSWLVNFGVINIHNQLARTIVAALYSMTEPVFRQVRRILPPFGGLDLSPLVVIFALYFLDRLLVRAYYL